MSKTPIAVPASQALIDAKDHFWTALTNAIETLPIPVDEKGLLIVFGAMVGEVAHQWPEEYRVGALGAIVRQAKGTMRDLDRAGMH